MKPSIGEPAYLTVGTAVSAKYRGAFCEATVQHVVQALKVKVVFKDDLSSDVISDEFIEGSLVSGATVQVKAAHGGFREATVGRIIDISHYTVEFDDGDEALLKRSALRLKGERHFEKTKTLNPMSMSDFDFFTSHSTSKKVNTRPRSSAIMSFDMACCEHESTSMKDLEDNAQSMMGKLVCVEAGQEKRKGPSWFPALVISPDCIDSPAAVRKEQLLVRSFQDGKFHCVSRKDVRIINRHSAPKTDPFIRQALEAGLRFQEYHEIPALWRASPAAVQQQSPQRSATTTRAGAAVVDDGGDTQEAVEMLDESNTDFLLQLFQFMEHRGTPIIKTPVLCYRNLDLFKLYQIVQRCGGCEQVKGGPMWKQVYKELGIPVLNSAASYNIKSTYKRYLYAFELYCQCAGISFGETCKPLKCQEAVADSLGETTEVGDDKHLQQVEDEERAESTSDIEDYMPELKTPNEGILEEEPAIQATPGVRLEPIILSKESEDSSFDQVDKVLRNMEGPQVERSLRYLASPECDSAKQYEGRGENGAGRAIEYSDNAKQENMGEEDEEECKEKQDNEEEAFDRAIHKEEAEDLILGTHVHVKYGRGKSLRTYEARICRQQHEAGDNHYLVHYLGWNSRHDEWIKNDRIVKDVHQRVDNFGYGRKSKVKAEDAGQGSTCIRRNRSTGMASRSPIAIFTKCLAKTQVESAPSTARQRRGKPDSGEEEGGYDFGAIPTGNVEWSLAEPLDTKTHLRNIETGCERDSAVKQMETRQVVKLQEDQDEDWGSIKDEPLAQIHQYSHGKISAWKDEAHNICQNDITSCTVVTGNVVSEEKSLDKSFGNVLQADHIDRRLASGELFLQISEVASRGFVFDEQRERDMGPSKSGTAEVFQDIEPKFNSPFVLQPDSDTVVFPNLGERSDPLEEKALKETDYSSGQMEDQQIGGTSFIMSADDGVDDSCNAGQFQEGCQSSIDIDCHRPLPGDDIDTGTVSAVKMKAFAALTWVAAERVSDNNALSVCNFPGNITQPERQTSFSPSSGNGEASPADGEGYQECHLERSERVCRSRYMRHRIVTTTEGTNRGPKRDRRSSERTRAKKRRACYKRSRMTSKAGQSSDSEDFSLSEPSHGKLSPPPSPGSLISSTDKPASFDVQIELPSLSGAARITWLQQRLQQIRAYYMALRSEVASIDRRLRKFRRRERQGTGSGSSTEDPDDETGELATELGRSFLTIHMKALTYSAASLDSHAESISPHAPLALDFG
uniref:AT-rich interactive domain-containing protein 4B-like isoform X2 n=1 Tax=Myxine glutinosa TaxID=7769 RepID=UPI00358E3D6D